MTYELKCCSLAFCCTENKIDGFESDSYTDSIYWRTIAWASCSSARRGVVWGTGRGSRWSQRTAKGLDFYSLWTSETHSSLYFTIPIWFDITEAGYSFFIEPFLKFQRGKSRQCVACIKILMRVQQPQTALSNSLKMTLDGERLMHDLYIINTYMSGRTTYVWIELFLSRGRGIRV